MFSLRARLLLSLLPVMLCLLAALAYANYFRTSEIFAQSAQNYLRTIVVAKEAALVDYIDSTEKIGAAIAATDIVQTFSELTNRKLSGRNQQTLEQLGRRVENLLYSLQDAHWGRYHHIFLINRSNRIVISPNHGIDARGTPSPLLGRDMSRNRWAMEALNKGVTSVSGYTDSQAPGAGQLLLFYPVRDQTNRVQAVIGFELQVAYQQHLITDGFDIGRSGRIYLATEKGVPVADQSGENRAPLIGNVLNETKLNGNASERRLNAQGREVISLYSKHQESPWILVTEIETGELFGKLYHLQIWLAAGLAASLVLVVVLLWGFAGSVAKPVRELTAYVERISLGEFGLEIPDARRKDEVGKLTEALQRLMFSLQIVAKKLRQAKALKKTRKKAAS